MLVLAPAAAALCKWHVLYIHAVDHSGRLPTGKSDGGKRMIPIGSEASKGGCEIPAKKLNFAFEHEISLLFFPCQYLNFFF